MSMDTLEAWTATGPAKLRFEAGEREEDADDPATAEFEDLASLHLEIPLTVRFHRAAYDAPGDVATTLFVGLDELPMERLLDPVLLDTVEEDSTVYLMDRHQIVTVRSLQLRPRGDGFSGELVCEVEFPGGDQRLSLDFAALPAD